MTRQVAYAAGLVAIGYVEQAPSTRYRVFYKEGGSPAWVWLGKSGAVRINSIKRIDGSIPASERTKKAILEQSK